MGLHHKSNKEKRKQKYAAQFERTANNKKKRIAKAEAKKNKGGKFDG